MKFREKKLKPIPIDLAGKTLQIKLKCLWVCVYEGSRTAPEGTH